MRTLTSLVAASAAVLILAGCSGGGTDKAPGKDPKGPKTAPAVEQTSEALDTRIPFVAFGHFLIEVTALDQELPRADDELPVLNSDATTIPAEGFTVFAVPDSATNGTMIDVDPAKVFPGLALEGRIDALSMGTAEKPYLAFVGAHAVEASGTTPATSTQVVATLDPFTGETTKPVEVASGIVAAASPDVLVLQTHSGMGTDSVVGYTAKTGEQAWTLDSTDGRAATYDGQLVLSSTAGDDNADDACVKYTRIDVATGQVASLDSTDAVDCVHEDTDFGRAEQRQHGQYLNVSTQSVEQSDSFDIVDGVPVGDRYDKFPRWLDMSNDFAEVSAPQTLLNGDGNGFESGFAFDPNSSLVAGHFLEPKLSFIDITTGKVTSTLDTWGELGAETASLYDGHVFFKQGEGYVEYDPEAGQDVATDLASRPVADVNGVTVYADGTLG